MASVTLAESAKLSQNQLVTGVIENIITVDRLFSALPFQDIEGNALAYNRELALGDVEFLGVGGTIAAKNPATFTPVTSSLTTIIGDAEVNGLVQRTRSDKQDQRAIQIASKAKSAGRTFCNALVNGTGAANQFKGLLGLAAAGQTLSAGNGAANGAKLTFDDLDALMDQVTDKDGQVDFISMNRRTLRSYLALLRLSGGAGIGEVVTLPNGSQKVMYRGVEIFANDYVPVNQTQGLSVSATTIIAGTFDDGSMSYGIAGLNAAGQSGLEVEQVGIHQSRDESIDRVKWYCGLANYSEKGLAILTGVNN